MSDETMTKKKVGFATMDRSKLSEIGRKGGKAVHAAGKGHVFTREEAREAGRKGGQAVHAKLKAKAANVAASTPPAGDPGAPGPAPSDP
jgi:general stress protein YciG